MLHKSHHNPFQHSIQRVKQVYHNYYLWVLIHSFIRIKNSVRIMCIVIILLKLLSEHVFDLMHFNTASTVVHLYVARIIRLLQKPTRWCSVLQNRLTTTGSQLIRSNAAAGCQIVGAESSITSTSSIKSAWFFSVCHRELCATQKSYQS